MRFAKLRYGKKLTAAAAAIMVGAQNDVLGFDRWLPDESKVMGVKLDSDRYDMSSAEPLNEYGFGEFLRPSGELFLHLDTGRCDEADCSGLRYDLRNHEYRQHCKLCAAAGL